jgi:hypothetical protein
MYLFYIFMIEAIFGVSNDLSNLYHGYFMFWGLLRVYNARVSLYKEASTPHLSKHNSHMWITITMCLLMFFSHHGALMWTFGVILWMLSLVLVDFHETRVSSYIATWHSKCSFQV